ncbi:GIY-YIG nuclease family protein [Bacillus horti]|uniref:Endonuclease n=1 Tax=Caldalkalibacillus horti TaxID=77523 RepID=A0ABT9W2T8_9BACI|nr:GIY-YIG nuclease family protein [Bacillus horti]MDQ0167562.1 putative endonuclease [Bacillus horti]
MKHYVYMLRCKDHSLYTGYTTDVQRRLKRHEEGKGAKYTRGRGPFEIVYVEECGDKSYALQREAAIKKLSTNHKKKLIEQTLQDEHNELPEQREQRKQQELSESTLFTSLRTRREEG